MSEPGQVVDAEPCLGIATESVGARLDPQLPDTDHVFVGLGPDP